MIVRMAMNQRWFRRLGTWRSPDEIIDTRAFEIAAIGSDKVARAFVEEHHYSGTYPAARERFGLYRAGELVGVAVFSHPPNEAVLAQLPCERMAGVELGRFVLLDSVPGNGESWFLARCFDLMRADGYGVVVSHSDPLPRRAADGAIVLPGHVGNVYQATNAIYAGRASSRSRWLLPDGTVFSERAMSKLRARERGYRYAIDQLVAQGADRPLDIGEDLTAWMWRELERIGRRVRHRGNHRYLWALDRHLRRQVGAMACGLPYPKKLDEAA